MRRSPFAHPLTLAHPARKVREVSSERILLLLSCHEMGEVDSWLETANFTSDGVDNCSAHSQGASSYSFQCE